MTELVPGLRADARTNRARILEVATEILTRDGAMASLKEIAEAAEVGRGTLYRHFPTREDLLATVLGTWADGVRETAAAAPASTREELVDWMERFAALSNTFRGLGAVMADAMDDDASPLRHAHQAGHDANEVVLARAREAGLVRARIDAVTLSGLITGVAMIAERAHLPADRVRVMLGVIADGLVTPTADDHA